jgi:hypothetical protein
MLIDKLKAGVEWVHIVKPSDGDLQREAQDLENKIRNAVAFNLTPLVGMYRAQEGPFSASRDTFAGIPPYPLTWCETTWREEGEALTVGALFDTRRHPPEIPVFVSQRLLPGAPGNGAGIFESPDGEPYATLTPEYLVSVTVVLGISAGRVAVASPTYSYLAGNDGRLLSKPASAIPVTNDDFILAFARLAARGHIAFFAFNLLSCKNVVEARHKIDRSLQKARHRKGKQPLTEYRTVEIQVPITRFRREKSDESVEAVRKRLHTVRGHFAEYAEDRRLFGKHTGRFWIPAHVRGAQEAGAIIKGYSLEPKQ